MLKYIFHVNRVCNFQNKLWFFMQKYINAKSNLNENYCKCVFYFQKIFLGITSYEDLEKCLEK